MTATLPLDAPPVLRSRGAGLGRLTATAEFLASVPRGAMVRALRSHLRAVEAGAEGRPVETRHGCDGPLFRLRTDAGRAHTVMWVEGED